VLRIRDPKWIKINIRIQDEHPESIETILGLKILEFFDADPGSGIFLSLDPISEMEKFESGINIPDPQH
jgi:hypothetical protein